MHPELRRALRSFSSEPPAERIALLQPIAVWCAARLQQGMPAHLVFVCAQNSRRSVFAQAWAIAAANDVGLGDVHCWSAGAENSAIAQQVVRELERSGFRVEEEGDETGEWILTIGEEDEALVLFSKTIDDPENPANGFAAVMVCGEEGCPLVPNADQRFPLTYRDPKVSDGSPDQDATYRERSEEIAAEMRWLMQRIKSLR